MLYSHNINAQDELMIIANDSLQLNYKNVYNEIKKKEIDFPDIVFCQAILESGHFKSKLVVENNNLFGMRKPRSRKTLAIGERYNYAIFNNWFESVADYKLWQENYFNNRCLTRKEYLKYLETKYCGYNNYIKKINLIHKKFNYLFI